MRSVETELSSGFPSTACPPSIQLGISEAIAQKLTLLQNHYTGMPTLIYAMLTFAFTLPICTPVLMFATLLFTAICHDLRLTCRCLLYGCLCLVFEGFTLVEANLKFLRQCGISILFV